jgi:hypothetical protein
MKIIHLNGYTEKELEDQRFHISRNIERVLKDIVNGAKTLGMTFQTPGIEVGVHFLCSLCRPENETFHSHLETYQRSSVIQC